MDINKSIGATLKEERIRFGYSLKHVSELMGYKNYQTLSSVESGKRELKAWELSKLASIYKRSIDYFAEPLRETSTKEPIVLWRKSFDSPEQSKIEKEFINYCRNLDRLLELTNEKGFTSDSLPLTKPSKQQIMSSPYIYIEQMAGECHDNLELGAKPAFTLSNILENALGINVFYLDLGSWGSAASTVSDYGASILINSTEAPWRRNYNLAHELFHIITWDTFTEEEIYLFDNKKSDVERWADAFASSLLLPSKNIRKEFNKRLEDKHISFMNLIELAREFGVSSEALLWRLVNLGYFKGRQVRKLLEDGELKDIDKKLRIRDWQIVGVYISERYVALAIRAYKMDKISKSKFSDYLNIAFSNVSSFLKKYGFDEEQDYSRELSIA